MLVVSSAPPGFPPLSAPSSLFSGPPPAVSSSSSSPLSPAAPVLAPPSSPFFSSAPPALSGFVAPGWGSSLALSVGSPLVPGPQPSLFRPFTVSDTPLIFSASALAPLSSASFSSAAGPSGLASTASGSTSGHAGFPPQPGPSSYIPPRSDSSAAPSAPLSRRLRILLTIPSCLSLRILKRPVLRLRILRLRCLLRCPTPFALRYAACTNIWWTSSLRLLRLLALSLRSSLPLRRLHISQCILRGLRESALLSLRLTPASRPAR